MDNRQPDDQGPLPHVQHSSADVFSNSDNPTAMGIMEEKTGRPTTPPPEVHGKEDDARSRPSADLESSQSSATDCSHGSDPVHRFEMSLIREIPFAIVICSTQILTQAGLGMTLVPLKIIGKSFGDLDPGQLSWFIAGYSLTVGTFILVAGRLGDMYGHKLMLILGFLWCALWSLVTGFSAYSHSQIFFDFCRAMQGIGPAITVPNSLAILGSTYPPGPRKNMIFSIYGATAPNGFLLGAVFSTLLAKFVWWPWAFWVMAIACCVLGCGAVFVVPSPLKKSSSHSTVQRFDFYGAAAGIVGLVLFNIAWNQAPIVGWQNPYVIVFLILGFSTICIFLLVERRVEQPLIPKTVLSPSVGFVLGCIALGWSSFGIWIYYFFQFITNLRFVDPLLGVGQAAPAGIAGICASLTTGFLLGRVPTPWVMAFAMVAFCVGNILLGTMPVNQSYWIQTFLATIITPWGMDMSFPSSTIILSNLVPQEHQGIAASLVVTVVNYSISLGLGIAGTVEVQVDRGGKDLLRGYRGAFYAAIGLSGLGVILAMTNVAKDRWRTRKTQKAP